MTLVRRDKPTIRVTVKDKHGNTERVTEQSHRIVSLTYTDSEKKTDKCVLTVDNFDLANMDDQLWAFGNRVLVSWGYPGQMAITRECTIRKVTGFTTLRVEARALSVLMDRTRRMGVFENKTRAEVVHEVAVRNGYRDPAARHIAPTATRFPFITQANITDAQFLRRLAHAEHYEFYVDHDGFHWHPRQLGQRPVRQYTYYTDPGRGDVMSISVENDITRKPGRVISKGRDSRAKGPTSGEADRNTEKGKAGLATSDIIYDDPEDNTTGVDVQHAGAQSIPDDAQTGTEVIMCMYPPGDEKTNAAATYNRVRQTAAKLKIQTIGDSTQLAKTIVELAGTGKRLNGLYYVKEVVHSVGAQYTMQLSVISDGTGGYARRVHRGTEEGLREVRAPKSTASGNPGTGPKDIDTGLIAQRVPTYDDAGNEIGSTVRWVEREQPNTVDIQDGGTLSVSGGQSNDPGV